MHIVDPLDEAVHVVDGKAGLDLLGLPGDSLVIGASNQNNSLGVSVNIMKDNAVGLMVDGLRSGHVRLQNGNCSIMPLLQSYNLNTIIHLRP